MEGSLGSVKNKDLIEVLNHYEEDTDITFEFLVASFFPGAYENMKALLKEAHTHGYIEATKELKGEKK